jgi:hypothetical protein
MKTFNFDIINKLRRQNQECIEDQGAYVSAMMHRHHEEGACTFWRKSVGCAIK